MNPEDRKRFDKMETVVEEIQADIREIKTAFLGNSMSGDRGFKGQIDLLKEKVEGLEDEIITLREERVETKLYILAIKSLVGIIAAGVVAWVFKKI